LASLVGDQRAEVETELVELAGRLDPVSFGRAARAVQGWIQPDVLAGGQRRQGFDRRFHATDTEDGGFAFSGLLYGTAAETARTAVQAFRRPDTPDEHRTPAQRGADAFEQLCAVALRSGEAPTRHGVRPQVLVTIDAADLALTAEQPDRALGTFLASGQPVAGPELRHLLADCQLLRVVLDADRVPIEVSTTVRTVPAGLWRALQVRDRGCVWPGCDAPAGWCDVAHAITPFADDGRLSLDNAMLLCRRHHRRYDAGSFTVTIDGTSVHFPGLSPPDDGDSPPAGGSTPPARGGSPPTRDTSRPGPDDPPPPGDGSSPGTVVGPSGPGSREPPAGRASPRPAARERRRRKGRSRGSPGDQQPTLPVD
jgi:hypothetical protein